MINIDDAEMSEASSTPDLGEYDPNVAKQAMQLAKTGLTMKEALRIACQNDSTKEVRSGIKVMMADGSMSVQCNSPGHGQAQQPPVIYSEAAQLHRARLLPLRRHLR